jgi:hypothetical protein
MEAFHYRIGHGSPHSLYSLTIKTLSLHRLQAFACVTVSSCTSAVAPSLAARPERLWHRINSSGLRSVSTVISRPNTY